MVAGELVWMLPVKLLRHVYEIIDCGGEINRRFTSDVVAPLPGFILQSIFVMPPLQLSESKNLLVVAHEGDQRN